MELYQLKENVEGTARIGLHIDPRFLKIDSYLSHMRRHQPKLDFHLRQRWSWQQPEAFKKGDLYGGFVYGGPGLSELEVLPLRSFNVVVVDPGDWAEKMQGAGWEAIARMPWIWTPPNGTFCKIALEAFESRGLQPRRVAEPLVKALLNDMRQVWNVEEK